MYRQKTKSACLLFWLAVILGVSLCLAGDVLAEAVEFFPAEGETVAIKKPTAGVAFSRPVDASSIFIMIDDLDVTSEASITETRVAYVAALPLALGHHDVVVQGRYADQAEFTHWWSFSITEAGERGPDEVSFRTDMTGNAFWLANDNDFQGALPRRGVEVLGPTHFKISEEKTSFEIRGNLYYFDQDVPPASNAVKEGADLRDFLIVATFAGENSTTEVGLGDISIKETLLTAPGLQRRGFYLQHAGAGTTTRLFSLNATPVYGVRDGLEIEIEKDKSLVGASVDLYREKWRSRFHLTVLSGSEQLGNGFSQADGGARSEGDTVGASWQWIAPGGKVRAALEAAASDYDADAESSSSTAHDDLAYRLNLAWAPSTHYEMGLDYETIGTDFVSIGNTGAVNDVRRISLKNGFYHEKNRFDLTIGYAVDNLDDSSEYPTTSLWLIRAEERYIHNEHINLVCALSREIIDSSDEPINYLATKTVVDRFDAGVAWSYETWSFAPSYTLISRDDQSGFGADTEQNEWRANLTLQPWPKLALAVAPQVILEDDKLTGVDYRTDSISILLNLNAVEELLRFDLSGIWQHADASDSSFDQRSIDYTARATIDLKRYLPDYIQPAIYLEGLYSRLEDDVLGTEDDELAVYLGGEIHSGFGY